MNRIREQFTCNLTGMLERALSSVGTCADNGRDSGLGSAPFTYNAFMLFFVAEVDSPTRKVTGFVVARGQNMRQAS
jgi:hypothetical protein